MFKRPVQVMKHFSRVFTKDGQFIRETGLRYTVTARLLGTTEVNTSKGPKELPYIECGHNHLTEQGASRCKKRLQRQYDALRSKIAQAAADKRRGIIVSDNSIAAPMGKLLPLGPIQKRVLQGEKCRFHPEAKVVDGHCTALDPIVFPNRNPFAPSVIGGVRA